MKKLGVNVDHIASIRELRKGINPDPLFYALLAEEAGADSIVCHLRADRRHIKDVDLENLKNFIHRPLNVEVGLEEEVIDKVISVKPDRITLVPEYRQEVTTECGLNKTSNIEKIESIAKKARENNIEVSLFIDPQLEMIDIAQSMEVGIVEIHTGFYVNAKDARSKMDEIRKILEVSRYAKSRKMFVAAGHGLDYHNIFPILEINEIQEFNIGYSIIVRAVFCGFYNAVKEMKRIIVEQYKI